MDITSNPQRYERGGDSRMRGIGDKKRVVIIPSSVSTRRAHEDERSLNLLGVLHRAATIINLNDISLKIPFQIPDGLRKTEEDRASSFTVPLLLVFAPTAFPVSSPALDRRQTKIRYQ